MVGSVQASTSDLKEYMASGHTLTRTDPLDAEPTFPFHPRSTLDTELTALIVGSIGTDLIDS